MDQGFIVGGFYAFQIQPDENDSQINAGKFGVFECIKKFGDSDLSFSCSVVVLDGMFETQPTYSQARKLSTLTTQHKRQVDILTRLTSRQRFLFSDRATFLVFSESLVQFQTHFLGKRLIPSLFRLKLAKEANTYAHLSHVSNFLDNEMRWRHDREDFEADRIKTRERDALKRAQKELRLKDRLKGLTIDTLLAETHLTAWDTREDFIPHDFLKVVRAEILVLLKTLNFTDKKQPKAQVRKNLKAFIEWLNNQDEKYDHPIETMEREELHELLEEVCHAAKHKSLVDEIDDWRDW